MVQEKTNTLIEFPCNFPIKIIGVLNDEFTNIIIGIIKKHVPSFVEHEIDMRGSSGGKYISLTCTVYVISKNQLDNLYKELSSHPMTKFVL